MDERIRLKFTGDTVGLEDGISILSGELGFESSEDGIILSLQRKKGDIQIFEDDMGINLVFERDIHFYRALSLLVEALRDGRKIDITESPQFQMNGMMFDVSRNAVMNSETIKAILRKMAIMGLDTIMLYTEDTYEVPDRPYFGYMRGRYTFQELKDYDDYANMLGIEIVPCIQTLAHLTQALKWDVMRHLRDTEDILLAENDETYSFIEEMIRAASAPFRSKRIHIGMDEAHMLGLGRYLQLNGFKPRFQLMIEHLNRVLQITSKLGLEPMMWSDMFFRLGSKTGDYYDRQSVIPEDVIEKVPKDVQLVYWDYYHANEDFYEEWIRRHKLLGPNTIFAGGIWTWNGISTNYGRTFTCTNAALRACKREGVREVFATLWNDNGGENNYFSSLLGLQLFAEHGYAETLDMDKLKRRFEFCTGASYEAFESLKYLDEIPGVAEGNLNSCNPSKYLLWQDPLIGLFDAHIGEESSKIIEHYQKLQGQFKVYSKENPAYSLIFEVAERLSSVLAIKADIGVRTRNSYLAKDLETLKKIAYEEIPELFKRVYALRDKHREAWFKTNKPFGWEVIDIRYGGVCARLESAKWRLTEYIEGRISNIPELEEERLTFNGSKEARLIHSNRYARIATASAL